MSKRNNLIEFARFLFSILVVGYHVQMTFCGDGTQLFENGALAVEFFFLISGYFLARSIEKINAKENANAGVEAYRFMKSKVKGIFPVHLTAIIAVVTVILVCDLSSSGKILLGGLPSVFLVQMAAVWNDSYASALIIPEWYLSAMLVCMLFMVPVALLLRKKLKGVFVTLILVGILGAVTVITGFCVGWALPQNFIYDIRAWGEMCVGMLAFYLSAVVAKAEPTRAVAIALKAVEVLGYGVPVILGIVPLSAGLQPVCMAVTVVCVFAAITVTFAGKGIVISSVGLNAVFGYLGGISLAIYLFHPVIITLLGYTGGNLALWAIWLLTFSVSLTAAVVYGLAVKLIKRLAAAIAARKREERATTDN